MAQSTHSSEAHDASRESFTHPFCPPTAPTSDTCHPSLSPRTESKHSSPVSPASRIDFADMLSASSLRDWMDFSSTLKQATSKLNCDLDFTTHGDHQAFSSSSGPIPKKQPGLHDQSNESVGLYGDDIAQLQVEPPRAVQSSDHRMHHPTFSFGGPGYTDVTPTDDCDVSPENFEAIEADIDWVKQEVLRLREAAADRKRNDSVQQEPMKVDPCVISSHPHLEPSIAREKPANDDIAARSELLSPAARLQWLHEQCDAPTLPSFDKSHHEEAHINANLAHFPSLSAPNSAARAEESATAKKASYAEVVGHGKTRVKSSMQEPGDDGFPTLSAASEITHTPAQVPRWPAGNGPSQNDGPERLQRQQAITGPSQWTKAWPNSQNNETSAAKSDIPVPGKSTRGAPHFAQPTKSFARRSDATVRKTQSRSPLKTGESSPTKLIKTKEIIPVADEHTSQRYPKRRAIPRNWLNDAETLPNSLEFDVREKGSVGFTPEPTPTPAESHPPSKKKLETRSGQPLKLDKKTVTQLDFAAQEHSDGKKWTSYMAPTASTLHRMTKRTDRALSPPKADFSSPESATILVDSVLSPSSWDVVSKPETSAASDTSSVVFILDKPNPVMASYGSCLDTPPRDMGKRPNTPASSPKVSVPFESRQLRDAMSPPKHRAAHALPTQLVHLKGSPEETSADGKFVAGEVSDTEVSFRSSQEFLGPILKCLDREGVLRRSELRRNSVVQSYLQGESFEDVQEVEATDAGTDDTLVPTSASAAVGHETQANPPQTIDRATSMEPSSAGKRILPGASASKKLNKQVLFNDLSDLTVKFQAGRAAAEAASHPGSLRATAKEFTPMPKQDEKRCSESDACAKSYFPEDLSFVPDDEWHDMPTEVRKAIINLRKWRQISGWPEKQTSTKAISPFSEQHEQPLGDLFAATPTISPTSDDTPAQGSRRKVSRWSIGSTHARFPFGWTRGDGKEIRFVGDGPYAEHNPNVRVNLNFGNFAGFGQEKEKTPTRAPVGPQSSSLKADPIYTDPLFIKGPLCGTAGLCPGTRYLPFTGNLDGHFPAVPFTAGVPGCCSGYHSCGYF